jgi:hypothetical protein
MYLQISSLERQKLHVDVCIHLYIYVCTETPEFTNEAAKCSDFHHLSNLNQCKVNV